MCCEQHHKKGKKRKHIKYHFIECIVFILDMISPNENNELYFLKKMIKTKCSAIHTTNLITLHNASDEEATNNGCPSPKRTFHIQRAHC